MKKGFKVAGTIALILIVSIVAVVILFGNKYPNDEPGTITKSQLKSLKEGMPKKEVIEKLGDPYKKDDDVNEWDYKGIDGLNNESMVMIFFDGNTVTSIVDDGLAQVIKADSNDSNDNQVDTETDDKDLVQYDTEDVINSFADENFKFDTKLDELEINDNLGTKKDGDYIALVHMTIGKTLSAKSGLKWIDNYTNYLASELAAKQSDITEITFFWTMPQFADKDHNVAKYTLKRNGKKFYFESEWQDKSLLNK